MKPKLLALACAGQIALSLTPSSSPAFDLITNGLVAYYQLNGNGDDSSGNGNNGTLHGTSGATDRFGNTGGALSFATDNDYVAITDADLAFASTSFTVSAWVRFDQYPTYLPGYGTGRDIVRRGNYGNYALGTSGSASNQAGFGFAQSGGGSGDWVNVDGLTGFDLAEWSLFTAVYDRSAGAIRLYINGQLDATRTNVTDPYAFDSTTTEIGNWYGTRTWEYPNLVGSIDDVLFYNRALSSTEVTSLFDIPEPPQIAGLMAVSLIAISRVRRRRCRS